MLLHIFTVLTVTLCATAFPYSYYTEGIFQYDLDLADELFEDFITDFHRKYADEAEKQRRFEIFKQNLQYINEKNLENEDSIFAITKFADMSMQEFEENNSKKCLGSGNVLRTNVCSRSIVNYTASYVLAPRAFDWRYMGAVTPARQQGDCGSCWAFGTVGTMEGAHAIKNGELIYLSPQQLVDCDKVSSGCDGGHFSSAFSALQQMGGSMTEANYPYAERVQTCSAQRSKVRVQLTGCHYLKPRDEEELKIELLNRGPLAVGIASGDLLFYNGSILKKCRPEPVNHAVLLVGYGEEHGVPFWVIKNSWGEDFAEDGFIRIIRGVNACGILRNEVYSAEVL